MNNAKEKTELNLWAVYGICFLISTIFFLLFGFNSPIYTFNSDNDYQWFMTMGNGLVHGKIPYRDLFEQKGPIVYFVTAFCCLFQNPGIVMLIIEIFSMSLFFFFAYRICRKRLNSFYSLLALPILAFAIFTSNLKFATGGTVEEFCLPILTYLLLCWLEFLLEKRQWNWVRSLCVGLCFGIMLWVKYTLFYFVLVPMLIWFIISLRRRQYRALIMNILCMIAGILLISAPVLAFYAVHNALDDLFYVYFYVNLTAYGAPLTIIVFNTKLFFSTGPIFLFLIFYTIIITAINLKLDKSHLLLLIGLLINILLLLCFCNGNIYQYTTLTPFTILGITNLLCFINTKINIEIYKNKKGIFAIITTICLITCTPLTILPYEFNIEKNEYTALKIAKVIKDYEKTKEIKTTLFCYKIADYGFYNAAQIIPNNYFYAENYFYEQRFPEMYLDFKKYIINKTSDFVITEFTTWYNEKDFLSQYYDMYTDEIYHSEEFWHSEQEELYFVLLIKK